MRFLDAIQRLAKSKSREHPQIVRFKQSMVLHDRFEYCLASIAERIQFAGPDSITAVIGPTGAGKSALVSEFGYQFGKATAGLPRDECPALLAMKLPAPERGQFSWRDDFYIPALDALGEPCPSQKVDVSALVDDLRRAGSPPTRARGRAIIPEYRDTFLRALERRRVVAALIDEAGHFRRPTGSKGIFAQYDSLKSRSDATKTHFVLLGTTELADIFKQSGQISRRVFPIWMTPYQRAEQRAFLAGLEGIQQKLERPFNFSLIEKVDEMQAHVFGEFGLLHDWVEEALLRAVEGDKTKIGWNMLVETKYTPVQRAGILRELVAYYAIEADANEVLAANAQSWFQLGALSAGKNAASTSSKSPRSGGPRARPGQRNPKRDPIS